MRVPQLRLIALSLVGGVALSGCAYGLGDPYGGGYGGVSVGYNSGSYGGGYGYGPYGYSGYGSPYGYANYGSYGSPYGYGYDPFGWYGNSYYPGAGIYVYDRYHRRRHWTNAERNYWNQRIASRRTAKNLATTRSIAPRENWSGFDRSRVRTSAGPATTQSPTGKRWQRQSSSNNSDTAAATTRPVSDGRRGRRNESTNEE